MFLITTAEDIQWSVVENARGRQTKVAFGLEQVTISGFFLHRV
jgi:hypothetical protein